MIGELMVRVKRGAAGKKVDFFLDTSAAGWESGSGEGRGVCLHRLRREKKCCERKVLRDHEEHTQTCNLKKNVRKGMCFADLCGVNVG